MLFFCVQLRSVAAIFLCENYFLQNIYFIFLWFICWFVLFINFFFYSVRPCNLRCEHRSFYCINVGNFPVMKLYILFFFCIRFISCSGFSGVSSWLNSPLHGPSWLIKELYLHLKFTPWKLALLSSPLHGRVIARCASC